MIEQKIYSRLKSINWSLPQGESPTLSELVSQVLSRPGKRVRPLLTLLLCDILKVDEQLSLTLAKIIEMIHVASLIHDDVIDNEKQRRSHPTINSLKENRLAVLAGDYLLSQALLELSSTKRQEMLEATTEAICRLVEGEWLQADYLYSSDLTENLILRIAKNKTASLLSLATSLPAMAKGYSHEEIAHFKIIGENLGMGFQILDDIWDHSLNNPRGADHDKREGVPNLMDYYQSREKALTQADLYLQKSIQDFEACLLKLEIENGQDYLVTYKKTLTQIRESFLS